MIDFAFFCVTLSAPIPLLAREGQERELYSETYEENMMVDSLTDQEIVKAILCRDTEITKEFLYWKCYPLFASIHAKYYTDCDTPIELINEIYVFILLPHKDTHRSKLQDFGFRCSLTMWLKIITENYCRQLFSKRMEFDNDSDVNSDRNILQEESLSQSTQNFNMADVYKILSMMPNQRYAKLIEYRYIDEKSNEETAVLLGMNMANYYNCHKRAKAQYCAILRKEGLI